MVVQIKKKRPIWALQIDGTFMAFCISPVTYQEEVLLSRTIWTDWRRQSSTQKLHSSPLGEVGGLALFSSTSWIMSLSTRTFPPSQLKLALNLLLVLSNYLLFFVQCLVWSMYQNMRWVRNRRQTTSFKGGIILIWRYQSLVFNCQVSAESILKQCECILCYWITVLTFTSQLCAANELIYSLYTSVV